MYTEGGFNLESVSPSSSAQVDPDAQSALQKHADVLRTNKAGKKEHANEGGQTPSTLPHVALTGSLGDQKNALKTGQELSDSHTISPALLPYGKALQAALQAQDLTSLLDARKKLHDYDTSQRQQGQEKSDAEYLTKLADGAWEKLKVLQLIQANGDLDSKTFGARGSDSQKAFEQRQQYRQDATTLISKSSLEQCADTNGTLLQKCAKELKGSEAVRVWEVGLEKDLLLYVGHGQAGWVSLDQAQTASGILSITPHVRENGMAVAGSEALTGSDILDLTKDGDRSFDSKYLESRLQEATELVPGVYLRHLAFVGDHPELRAEGMLSLQGMILPENWERVRDDNVKARFAALQKQEGADLQRQLAAINGKNLSADALATEQTKIEVNWSKDFAQKTYEYVRDERKAGSLQLTADGETAFRELDGMYGGGDAKREQANRWMDTIAIDGSMMVVSGGVGNIARAGAKVALERYIARSVGQEGTKSLTARVGVYAASKAVEGYVYQTSRDGLDYLGGNHDAFKSFWGEGLASTVSFMGMHGSDKLAGAAVLGIAERTLPAETRTIVNAALQGEQKQAFLAQVIQSNAKLRLMNSAGQLSAQTLYLTLQGQTEAVINGKPLATLLSPQEWADALGNSAMRVAALKVGRNLTQGVEQSLGHAQNHVEADAGKIDLPNATTSRTWKIDKEAADLYRSNFNEEWSTDAFQEMIDRGDVRLDETRAADGKLLAFSFVAINADGPIKFANLDFIAVDTSLRSQGIGTEHFQRVAKQIQQEHPDYRAITLEMEDPNQPGLTPDERADRQRPSNFYERLGAKNELPAYWQNTAAGGKQYVAPYQIIDPNRREEPGYSGGDQPAEWRVFWFDKQGEPPLTKDAKSKLVADMARLFYSGREGTGYNLPKGHPALESLEVRLQGRSPESDILPGQ
jgi:ribosomal protein S18 acetylase RimI-like enzyme